ncbi:colicin immunity domain-containing protein [Micromonospora chersina]|uniref:colicin immunity domain-containing protein n=1 Tax=Micromonospora chersina TaxID=47854 RepID=UPI0034075C23
MVLARALVEERLTGLEFETLFLSVFKGEGDQFESRIAAAVQQLFDAVEAYCDDPHLRDAGDFDLEDLRRAAADFLALVV